MNHSDFAQYHNRHIMFEYCYPKKPIEKLNGVVLDIINYREKKTPTEYIFIQTNDLHNWKKADEIGDVVSKRKLERKIDIQYITRANIIK